MTASATATITIARAVTVLQWLAPASTLYGTPLGSAQLNATSNVAGTFFYSPAAGAQLGAGSHVLCVTFTPNDATNYTGATGSTALTVARAPLTVRANDAVKPFGAPLPVLTASFSGFVNGESAGSLGGTLALATSATQQSPVGAYRIMPSGLSSPNYTIAFVNGTLAVVRGAVVVSMGTSPEPSGFEGPMTFTAASVAAAAPSSGTPSGVVRFYDGATLIGSAPLTGGTAASRLRASIRVRERWRRDTTAIPHSSQAWVQGPGTGYSANFGAGAHERLPRSKAILRLL